MRSLFWSRTQFQKERQPRPFPVVYDGPEYSVKVEDDLVASKPWISDECVSVPTMTVYPPKTENTGAASLSFRRRVSDPRHGFRRY
jgi:hypothetical protein